MNDNVEIETQAERKLFVTNIEKLESCRNTRYQNGRVKSFTDKLEFKCILNDKTEKEEDFLKRLMKEPVIRSITIRGERFYMPKDSDSIFFWYDKGTLNISIRENKKREEKSSETKNTLKNTAAQA